MSKSKIEYYSFSMYEKIISHLDIDEIGTNFPQVSYFQLQLHIEYRVMFLFRIYTTHIGGAKILIMKNWVCGYFF